MASVTTWEGHTDAVNCLDVAGTLVASCSDDSTVRLWDGSSGKAAHCIGRVFGNEPVNCVCFNPKKPNVIFAAAATSVYGFDIRTLPSDDSAPEPLHL